MYQAHPWAWPMSQRHPCLCSW